MAAKDPKVRSQAARIAALARWSKQDTTAGTQAMRDARLVQFENEVDPRGELPAKERRVKALRLRRSHMLSLSMRSAAARAEAA